MKPRLPFTLFALAAVGFGIAQTLVQTRSGAAKAEPGTSAAQAANSRTVLDVANHLWRVSGIQVYVDPRIARERAPMPGPDAEISESTLQGLVEKLAKAASPDAIWAKLYLPLPPKGKNFKAEDVVAFARAQAALFGTVGAVEADSIEILSQKVAPDKAKVVISALELRPVYVISIGRGNFAGVWQTTFGEMRLTQVGGKVSGTYGGTNGEIEGVANGAQFNGRWYEQNRTRGGPVQLTLAPDGESFAGQWAYDEGIQAPSAWTGARVSRK